MLIQLKIMDENSFIVELKFKKINWFVLVYQDTIQTQTETTD